MFVLIATIAAFVFAAPIFDGDEDSGPDDIYVRLGWPKMEEWEYRIHVGKEGEWTAQMTQVYSIAGVTTEDANAFREMLYDQARDCRMPSISWSCEVRENRCQCESEGKSDDALELASLLVRVFQDDKCNFLRWDRESFEWRFLRDSDHLSSGDEKKTAGEFFTDVAVNVIVGAVMNEELRKKGVTQAELESLETFKCQLLLTTDGKITADAPAEVSEDGKTLTLDLSKFVSDPPEQWSIRIDGL